MPVPYISVSMSSIRTNAVDNTSSPYPAFSTSAPAQDYGLREFINASVNRFQGSVSGYVSGGFNPSGYLNNIEKFPFASSSTNASDIANLYVSRSHSAGHSSITHGYTSGGYASGSTPSYSGTIDKFPFASDSNASSVGFLTVGRQYVAGVSTSLFARGYSAGGYNAAYAGGELNVIDYFPFVSDASAQDTGDLTDTISDATGVQSLHTAYIVGNFPRAFVTNVRKFPFASTTVNAVNAGSLSSIKFAGAGHSSPDYGFFAGGSGSPIPPPSITNVIDRFPFASDATASSVANLSRSTFYVSGQSSTSYGYSSGGITPPPTSGTNIIDRYQFLSLTPATDVGDLSVSRYGTAGQQD